MKKQEMFKLSRWSRKVVQKQNPARPVHILHHTLSGETVSLNPTTLAFVDDLLQKREVSVGDIVHKCNVDLQVLRRLIAHHFLVKSQTGDEFDLFLEHFPVKNRQFLFYRGRSGSWFFLGGKGLSGRLDTKELDFLHLCDGKKKISKIVKLLAAKWRMNQESTLKWVRSALEKKFCHPKYQIIKLSPTAISEHLHQIVKDFEHSQKVLASKVNALKGETVDLHKFHRSEIPDAQKQFDSVEVTISHALREPSPVLGNRSYGMAFCDELLSQGAFRRDMHIVEVGGGTGYFAKEFLKRVLERVPDAAETISYTIVDLAPELQRNQRKINRGSRIPISYIQMNAENLTLPRKADLLISNEVIADFRTTRLQKTDVLNQPEKRRVTENAVKLSRYLIQHYGLDVTNAPDEFYFNLGAILFLEKIKHVLAPGGLAAITEYGSLTEYPNATHHLNHNEYSIQWNQILRVAQKQGFKNVKLQDLGTFLPFNPYESMLIGRPLNLSRIFKHYGKNLPLLAYTESQIKTRLKEIPEACIEGLTFAPFHVKKHWGPGPRGFNCLLIKN